MSVFAGATCSLTLLSLSSFPHYGPSFPYFPLVMPLPLFSARHPHPSSFLMPSRYAFLLCGPPCLSNFLSLCFVLVPLYTVSFTQAVRPDHDLMANLRQSCVKAKVTQYGKAELDICVQLISKLSKLTEVDLSCGDDMMASKKKKRVSKRFAAVSSRSGVREPMVQTQVRPPVLELSNRSLFPVVVRLHSYTSSTLLSQGCALRIVRAITKRLLPADANLKRLLGASLGGKNRKAQGEVESKASDQSRKKLNASLSLTSSLAEGPLGLGNGSVLTAIALPGVRLTLVGFPLTLLLCLSIDIHFPLLVI